MFERKTKPIAVAVGAVFAAALATASVAESDSALFAVDELDRGYDRLVDSHAKDGSCGEGEAEGSCGEGEAEGSCGEGEAEGSCGEGEAEGKCGEGKCGEGEEAEVEESGDA